ncbi:MAG: 16S rRNA (guanine(527)-N(7))-methyltransferase RsmG [Planctomycetota bacterium]
MPAPDFVREELDTLQIELTPDQLERLSDFLHIVLDTNRRMNLTAVRDPAQGWRRLIVDSLTVLPGLDELPMDAKVVDVGSGGGFPGIPVAVARPSLQLTLIEATRKKAEHLRRAADALELDNVVVINRRAEEVGRDPSHRQSHHAAISRAVGHLSPVLEYCMPLVKVGGRVLAMKGPSVERELDASVEALVQLGGGDLAVIDAYPESFSNGLLIVSVMKERGTPGRYPRAPGVPRSQPL